MGEKIELCLCKSHNGYCIILNDCVITDSFPVPVQDNIIKTWQVNKTDIEKALKEKSC